MNTVSGNSASSKPGTPSASTVPTQPLYQAYPTYTTTPHTVVYIPPVPQRRRSFCGWLLRAFMVFLAFFIVLKSISYLVRGSIDIGPLPIEPSQWSYDIPTEVNYDGCISGDKWKPWNKGTFSGFPYSSTTSFDVPLADGLYLLERGQLSGGRATYTTSSGQPSGTAKVQITGWYHRRDLFGLVKACSVQRSNWNKENGVGIFTPRWSRWYYHWRREDKVNFDIVVTLPEGASKASPRLIKSFVTDIPNTSQELQDLSSLLFDSITIKGSNSAIKVAALRAHEGTLITSNGHISGKFDTDSNLSLKTSNGGIDIDVALSANKTDSTIKLNAVTSNAKMRAGVSLLSSKHEGGNFEVTTKTSNGRSSVSIPDAPVDSKLLLTSTTSNAHADVSLHPTYEGKFVVTTSRSSKIEVIVDDKVKDPSGQQRKRSRVGLSRRGSHSGEVFWGDKSEKTKDGVVKLATSNGEAILSL
ncbi:hypothetical protein D9619_002088 [Psilocybe cf. subviscida]|uniref:Uncharacterized protein n=1 Tax=Psilocybe cf. subviscida TaxID=2480587 RepID=A0A8H5F2F5_9AGAR|nr:hypothetical protein D9619_002088 [Psilocybe cf. subviscida]